MPVGPTHHVEDLEDEFIRHSAVKKVAHRVHENGLRFFPLERKFQGALVEGRDEAIRVIRLAHRLESQSHPFRVAMLATRADLRAARERVPRGFRPLNC